MDIPDEAQKEIEFLYLRDIVSKVEKYDIPFALVVNIDQRPFKCIPVGNKTMASKGEHSVAIERSADKSSITGIFVISFDGNFLLVHLIHGGKTTRSLPRFEFPKDFSFSINLKRLPNTDESLKFLKEVIKPYVIKQRQILKCSADQKALVIMNVFTGQMATVVLDAFQEANICIDVPAKAIKFYQPLHLTANVYCKNFSNVN